MSGKKKNDKFKDIFLNSERINWHNAAGIDKDERLHP